MFAFHLVMYCLYSSDDLYFIKELICKSLWRGFETGTHISMIYIYHKFGIGGIHTSFGFNTNFLRKEIGCGTILCIFNGLTRYGMLNELPFHLIVL